MQNSRAIKNNKWPHGKRLGVKTIRVWSKMEGTRG